MWIPVLYLISKLLKLSFPQFQPFWNGENKHTVDIEIRWLNSTCCSFVKLCPTLCDPMDCSRFPCLSLFPGVCSNSCPVSQWCYLIISSSVTLFSSCLSVFASIRVFPNESAVYIRWPKFCSFSFSISTSTQNST